MHDRPHRSPSKIVLNNLELEIPPKTFLNMNFDTSKSLSKNIPKKRKFKAVEVIPKMLKKSCHKHWKTLKIF